MFIVLTLALLVFGPKLGATVTAWLGLGDLFATVWSVASLLIVLASGLLGVGLVYHLAPATRERWRRERWRWVTPGAVLTGLALLLGAEVDAEIEKATRQRGTTTAAEAETVKAA